jgi:hypothetical protein
MSFSGAGAGDESIDDNEEVEEDENRRGFIDL